MTSESYKSLTDLDIEGRRVMVRLDLDVPFAKDGSITDDARIRAALPTLRHAIDQGARIIIAAHRGNPGGECVPALSMAPVGERLAELLEQEIVLPEDCVGDGPRFLVSSLREGQVVLLENMEFRPGERSCEDSFSRQLAALADVYINDALKASVNRHASTAGAPLHIRQRGIGFLLQRELENLRKLVAQPLRPNIAVMGGNRVQDKIEALTALLPKLDAILIGGGVAATFLAARELEVGASEVEPRFVAAASRLLSEARKKGVEVILPADHMVVSPRSETPEVINAGVLPADGMICDIGPATLSLFARTIAGAHTVFWYGPMGMCEQPQFAAGTEETARLVAHSGAFVVIGGAAAVEALTGSGLHPFVSHITSGDGATLKWLQGSSLPGLDAVKRL